MIESKKPSRTFTIATSHLPNEQTRLLHAAMRQSPEILPKEQRHLALEAMNEEPIIICLNASVEHTQPTLPATAVSSASSPSRTLAGQHETSELRISLPVAPEPAQTNSHGDISMHSFLTVPPASVIIDDGVTAFPTNCSLNNSDDTSTVDPYLGYDKALQREQLRTKQAKRRLYAALTLIVCCCGGVALLLISLPLMFTMDVELDDHEFYLKLALSPSVAPRNAASLSPSMSPSLTTVAAAPTARNKMSPAPTRRMLYLQDQEQLVLAEAVQDQAEEVFVYQPSALEERKRMTQELQSASAEEYLDSVEEDDDDDDDDEDDDAY